MELGWRTYHARSEGRHWLDRAMQHWEFYVKFHRKLEERLAPGAELLDVGCGMGYSALYFAAHGYPVTGIDTDPESVREAGEWGERMNLPARFLVADAFAFRADRRFALAYSMGLIEHFSPEKARRFLARQADCSELVAALAPTPHSDRTLEPCPVPQVSQSFGSLQRLFREAGLEVIDRFGTGMVSSRWEMHLANAIPPGLLHFLQNRIAYAMGICIVGRRN
jgi:SAM-dependent methyltransferase